MKRLSGFLIAAALLALYAIAAYNPANLGNGWYGNLPPVTRDQLKPVLACMVLNNAPVNPELFVESVYDWGDGKNQTPTMVQWSFRNGHVFVTDAVWTYYAPEVAFVEIMAQSDTPATRDSIMPLRACISHIKSPGAVVVQAKNPLGVKQEQVWCQSKMGVDDCWQGNQDDQFIPGGEFRDATGLYRKVSGGYFIFSWSAWRRV